MKIIKVFLLSLILLSADIFAQNSNQKVYTFIEVSKAPEYSGGMRNFYLYLYKNFKLPNIECFSIPRFNFSFIVEKNGSLSDLKIENCIYKEWCDELLRVIKKSPKWQPGYVKGERVRSRYRGNIIFELSQ